MKGDKMDKWLSGTIIKVQLPLIGDIRFALVYNENRALVAEQGIDGRVRKIVEAKGMKAYFYGDWDRIKMRWIVKGEAPGQEW